MNEIRTVELSGSVVPKYGVSMVSILGIVIVVLGRYLVVGYLDN